MSTGVEKPGTSGRGAAIISEERLREMLARSSRPPTKEWDRDISAALTELLSLRSDAHTNGEVEAREAFLNLIADAIKWEENPDGDADDNGRPIDCTTYSLEVSRSSLQDFCADVGIRPKWSESLKDCIDRLACEPPEEAK